MHLVRTHENQVGRPGRQGPRPEDAEYDAAILRLAEKLARHGSSQTDSVLAVFPLLERMSSL